MLPAIGEFKQLRKKYVWHIYVSVCALVSVYVREEGEIN